MLREWIDRWRQKRREREAVELLHAFDDRKLADVGTFRDSIELFVAEQAGKSEQGAKNGKAG
nr:hypothetical protein [uncultured Devosia sp.]